jgi:hypothetical protein
MDALVGVAEKVGEAFSDYKRGRSVRLGTYSGPNNVKKLGHYDASGKLLGIYHG